MQFIKIISVSPQTRMKIHKYALWGKCRTVPLTRRNRTIRGQSALPKWEPAWMRAGAFLLCGVSMLLRLQGQCLPSLHKTSSLERRHKVRDIFSSCGPIGPTEAFGLEPFKRRCDVRSEVWTVLIMTTHHHKMSHCLARRCQPPTINFASTEVSDLSQKARSRTVNTRVLH